jgi:hypothetical protein
MTSTNPKASAGDVLGAIGIGTKEMGTRHLPVLGKAKIGRPPVGKVQLTCRVTPDLLNLLDEEVNRLRKAGVARAKASQGPVLEALVRRALQQSPLVPEDLNQGKQPNG